MGRYGRGRWGGYYGGYGGFAPYVPVAQRHANGARQAEQIAKKEGRKLVPVKIVGRAMATTFWGKAWCDNLEAYSDFANRLPRGRTYARNGSVLDLQITKGKVEAMVAGSSLYRVTITIETLSKPSWSRIKAECSQSIASLIDLLQGRFDAGVMQRLAHPNEGLFPHPEEIEMDCSCPDWAGVCKHVAAALYGVGNRLDNEPQLLFTLRNVDHIELVSAAVTEENLDRTLEAGTDSALAGSDLGEIFGIELDTGTTTPAPEKPARAKKTTAAMPQKTARAKRQPAPKPKAAAKPKSAAKKKVVVAVAAAVETKPVKSTGKHTQAAAGKRRKAAAGKSSKATSRSAVPRKPR